MLFFLIIVLDLRIYLIIPQKAKHYSLANVVKEAFLQELLSYRLNTIHTLHFDRNLMARIRKAIANDSFSLFLNDFYGRLMGE
jgi:tRNA-guanine family transglycosylase